jgi:hypothetical protein
VHLFEHFEYTDVGAALGATAGEHQAHARALRGRRRCRRIIDMNGLRRHTESGQQTNCSDQLRAETQ